MTSTFEKALKGICPNCNNPLDKNLYCQDCDPVSTTLDPDADWDVILNGEKAAYGGNTTDADYNQFQFSQDDSGPVVECVTPTGFRGKGRESGEALKSALWYEAKDSMVYEVKPINQVINELTSKETLYWWERTKAFVK